MSIGMDYRGGVIAYILQPGDPDYDSGNSAIFMQVGYRNFHFPYFENDFIGFRILRTP